MQTSQPSPEYIQSLCEVLAMITSDRWSPEYANIVVTEAIANLALEREPGTMRN